MLTRIRHFIRDEKGATAIEYGLIAALLAVVIIGVLTTLGGDLQNIFTDVSEGLQGASGTGTGTTPPATE